MKEANLHIEYNQQTKTDAPIERSVIRALLYFDLFNYPLTLQEIILFSSIKYDHLSQVEDVLNKLVESFKIYKFEGFYSIKNDSSLIERRKSGNKAAAEVSFKLRSRARFIHRFPFVRSVNVSGSLSKNYFDETTDFDFFIITASNRIWLTRMFLTLFKKIFLLNNRRYFCINYYIDCEDLAIPDRNIFSATEIITLKNQTGELVFRQFLKENNWVHEYFPNYSSDGNYFNDDRRHLIKSWTEKIFSGKFGDRLDNMCRAITLKFLKRKYYLLSEDQFNLNFRTKKHASKHHPQGFQEKVIKAFEEKCRDYETNFGIDLR